MHGSAEDSDIPSGKRGLRGDYAVGHAELSHSVDLLDDIDTWDDFLDKVQEYLSPYRPEGGAHLVDEKAMETFVLYALARLKARNA